MATSTTEEEKDRAEIASEEGFTGTFAGFIDWLRDALSYGDVRVHEEAPDGFGQTVIKVETVTGGFSSDEHLLGRVSRNVYMQTSWDSSHRGGLTVYEVPLWLANGTDDLVWLEPEDGIFERIHRARHVRLYDQRGGFIELAYGAGVELAFQEPDRDIIDADGVLSIRPITAEHQL